MTTHTQDNQTLTLYPEGKITAANADAFRQELLEHVQAGRIHLTIDLSRVDIIDSKGLAVFIVCYKTVSEKGGSLAVIADNNDFRNLFHVMRLDKHFSVRSSRESEKTP
ncbi:MAG: STAS domain-containing protein [Sedimentisphaerales bacterium]|nr:STAS domain-containing protein [Sedimentisphaerales bacterium]